MPETTAAPRMPVPDRDAMFSRQMPPMATTGIDTLLQMARQKKETGGYGG